MRQSNPILTAVLLKGNSYQETLLKTHLLRHMLVHPARCFSGTEVVDLAEDLNMAFSDEDIFSALETTCLYKKTARGYVLKEGISLAELWVNQKTYIPRALKNEHIETAGLHSLLFNNNTESAMGMTPRKVFSALRLAVEWVAGVVKFSTDSSQKLASLPAYFRCGENGDVPIGFSSAGTANADALSAVVEGYKYLGQIGGIAMLKETLPVLVEYLASCQVDTNNRFQLDGSQLEWNTGGFHPQEDQPGSECPTVDATWDAVIGLALARLTLLDEGDRIPNHKTMMERMDISLINGIRFLLRQQLPDGGWSIYRYRDDSFKVVSNEYTTSKTITAISLARASGAFDNNVEELYAQSQNSLLKAYDLIRSSKVIKKSHVAWLPYFKDGSTPHTDEDLLIATMHVTGGLLSLSRTLPDLREELHPLLQGFIHLATSQWTPNHERISRYRFRVPLRTKLNSVQNMWQHRKDTLMTLTLLNICNARRIVPEESLWERIEEVMGHILTDQHPQHGHWNDVASGEKPFIVNTLFALETLVAYADSWNLVMDW